MKEVPTYSGVASESSGRTRDHAPPQISAEHLWTPARAVVRLVEQDRAMLVEHARSLAALVDDRAELVGEAGRFERALPFVLVDVELAALGARPRRRLGLVDGRGDAVPLKNPGEGQAAEPGADDRDRDGGSLRFSADADPSLVRRSILVQRSNVGTTLQSCQDDDVPPRRRRSPRRTEALSRERIVETAVELLDASGEGGLTFRGVTERLGTGAGGIFWGVGDQGGLPASATDAVVAAALAVEPAGSPDSSSQDR